LAWDGPDGGYITEQEFERDIARLNGPDFVAPSPIMSTAWGQRSQPEPPIIQNAFVNIALTMKLLSTRRTNCRKSKGATVRRLGEIAPVAAHRGSRTKTWNRAPAGVPVDSTVGNRPTRSSTGAALHWYCRTWAIREHFLGGQALHRSHSSLALIQLFEISCFSHRSYRETEGCSPPIVLRSEQ
jgi:hypothetical protein